MATNNVEKTAERIQSEVPTVSDETQPSGSVAPAPSPSSVPPSTPTEGGEPIKDVATPSAKDNFRSRFSSAYPDVNMDDEEAYYGQANKTMDEYEGYKKNLDNVRNAVGSSEDFQEMLAELSEWNQEHPDEPYSIMHFIAKKVREGELDLDELKSNPEYADQIAAAQAKKTKDADEKKALEEEGAKNFDESIAMMQRVGEDRGLSPEQVNTAMEKLYGIFDNLAKNIITEEDFNAILDSMNYSEDVESARQEGQAAGLNTKVTDKLRKMPQTSERAGGSQTAMSEQKPKQETKTPNMFGL